MNNSSLPLTTTEPAAQYKGATAVTKVRCEWEVDRQSVQVKGNIPSALSSNFCALREDAAALQCVAGRFAIHILVEVTSGV